MAEDKPFPIRVEPVGPGEEEVAIIGPGFRLVLCNCGAEELGYMLHEVTKDLYCDGYRHGDKSSMFVSFEVTGP
jgi:hypothetical protein